MRFEKLLLENNLITPDGIEGLRVEVDKRIADAVEAGRAAPNPDVSEVFEHVYA